MFLSTSCQRFAVNYIDLRLHSDLFVDLLPVIDCELCEVWVF